VSRGGGEGGRGGPGGGGDSLLLEGGLLGGVAAESVLSLVLRPPSALRTSMGRDYPRTE